MFMLLVLFNLFTAETKPVCDVTQAQLDAEYESTGGYEITVEEFCEL